MYLQSFSPNPEAIVSIKPPLCVYSSTPLGQSWAGWPAPALRWKVRGRWSAGRAGAGRSERSRGSRPGESAWRSGRLPDLARSSPPSKPPGRCSLLVPRRSCRGRQHTVKSTSMIHWGKSNSQTNIECHEPIFLWGTVPSVPILSHRVLEIHSSEWNCLSQCLWNVLSEWDLRMDSCW